MELNESMSDDSMNFGDFMQEMEANVMEMIKKSSKAPKDLYEHIQAFASVVNWQETWIICLLSTHALLFTFVVLTRKNIDVQTILFGLVCLLILASEKLNTYCSENWKSFSTQNYFDSHGVFASTLYAGPLLLIALFQLMNFLWQASTLLIKVKRAEFLQMKKPSKSTDSSSSTPNEPSSGASTDILNENSSNTTESTSKGGKLKTT